MTNVDIGTERIKGFKLNLCVSASCRMSVSDFQINFEVMEVCHLTDALSTPGSSVRPWSCIMHHGNWVPSITAGGSHQSGKMQRSGCLHGVLTLYMKVIL